MKNNLSIFFICAAILISSCKKIDNSEQALQSNEFSLPDISVKSRDAGGSTGGVDFECKSCLIPYPDNSNLPRSAAVFNENEVLAAFEPGMATCGTHPTEIKVWYADEHPLCLGVKQVIIKTKTGTATYNYPITASPLSAAIAVNPQFGITDQSGDDLSGNDVSVDGGRPLWPALYITDITDDLTSRSGDWQQGGTAVAPDKIYGMWKSVTKIVDKTKTPNVVTIQVDADTKNSNGWNLAGGQTPPPGTIKDKYGALVTWNVERLGLLPGHTYRLQFMVHDGDQNKLGGDVGQSCTTIIMPG
jgi:hypothetical protein